MSIQLGLDRLEFFLTQTEYFELHYFIVSILYAQAKQWDKPRSRSVQSLPPPPLSLFPLFHTLSPLSKSN